MYRDDVDEGQKEQLWYTEANIEIEFAKRCK